MATMPITLRRPQTLRFRPSPDFGLRRSFYSPPRLPPPPKKETPHDKTKRPIELIATDLFRLIKED